MGTFTEQWIDISEYEQYSTDIKFRAHTAPLVIFNGKYLSVDILLCHCTTVRKSHCGQIFVLILL